MENILSLTQVIISVLLMFLILIQNREGGLNASFGRDGEGFTATKRGAEKVVDYTTVLLGFLFMANALMFVLI